MLGVLGGTFDPIHNGHLRAALETAERLDLAEVRFVPLLHPPHRDTPQVPPEERLELVRLAVAGESRFLVDERELRRGGPSYTLDTLLDLRKELADEPVCLLLGDDAFLGFPDWHQPASVLELAHLVVMRRPNAPPVIEPRVEHLLRERETSNPGVLRNSPGGRIFPIEITQLDISATSIRGMLRSGLSPRYLLPESVLDRIIERNLYCTAVPEPRILG